MVQTLECFYGASAARAALTALVPQPSPTWTITGVNWVEINKRVRVLKSMLARSNVVADFTEWCVNASHDPNNIRSYLSRDVTANASPALAKMNYPLINKDGNTAIMRTLGSNVGAEITTLLANYCSEDDRGLTVTPPALPPNARWISFTEAVTSVLGTWVGAVPVFAFNFLPGTRYGIYGGQACGATLNGVRFVPKTGSDPADLRPGFPGYYTDAVAEAWYQVDGRPLLVFDGANPPDIEVVATTAAAQGVTGSLLIAEM